MGLIAPQDSVNDSRIGLALRFHKRVAVYVHRGRDLSVPHEFLLHSHRCPGVVQPRTVRVTERVPANFAEPPCRQLCVPRG